MSSPADLPGLRHHQLIFAASASLVFVAGIVFAMLAPVGDAAPGLIEALFYASAAAALVGGVAAYFAQQSLITRLAAARSREEAMDALLFRGMLSLVSLEASALLALVGYLLSADSSFYLFVLPFAVGLAVLFPTAERAALRLAVAGH